MGYVILFVVYLLLLLASNIFYRFITIGNKWIFAILTLSYVIASQIYILGISELLLLWKRNSSNSLDFGHANQLLVWFWVIGSLTMIVFLVKFFILRIRNK